MKIDEIKSVLSSLGEPLPADVLEGFIKEFDPHGTGKISRDVFVTMADEVTPVGA